MNQTGGTVFIVDDDPSVRRGLGRLVKSVGLNAATFPSAEAFLNATPDDAPSCLVLDIRMPGVTGLQLQEKLKTANRVLPIVFITGHGNIPMSVRAMKSGAVDFLEKPFDDRDLLDAILRALEQDHRRRKKTAAFARIQKIRETLTPRENEVFVLVVQGLLNKQIAHRLGISEKTTKVHRARVMEKMQADSLAHLVRLAEKLGIFGTPH
jgi:RNA polymerase sigma factor (sigma-70 family)